MQDMCGIHLGIYLKTISHPGFNTFPHQGSTKLHLNENWGIMDYPPSQTPFSPAVLAVSPLAQPHQARGEPQPPTGTIVTCLGK